jgi:hypothetical protein
VLTQWTARGNPGIIPYVESDLEVIAAGDTDPAPQALRVRRWRPVVVAASSLGIIALLVAIALLLSVRSDIGDLRAAIKEERQERRQALTTIRGDINSRVVPEVVGLTVFQAKALLVAAGLEGAVYTDDPTGPDRIVQAQEPGPGEKVVHGAAVGLRTANPHAVAFAGPICPPAVEADAIGADALPPAGSDVEDREHVDELLRSNETKIRRAFPEVEGLAVGAGRGRAWVRDDTGAVSIVKVEDFAIHAHVPSVEACPSPERQSAWPVNIPLIFVIGSGG